MRIGIIISDLNGGGAERAVLQLAGGLLERGHQVDLILLRPLGRYFKTIPSGVRLYRTAYPFQLREVPDGPVFLADAARHGLAFERLPVSPWGWYRAFRALRRRWPEARITPIQSAYAASIAAYLRKNRPDVVFGVLHRGNVAAVCGRTLAGAEIPIAVSIRNNIALRYSDAALVRARALYKEADAVIAVSNGVAEGAAGTLGLDLNRIIAIPNPIPTAKIATAAAEPVEHPWFAEGGAPVVLTAGRPEPQKDHPTLIRAFALLRRSMEARLAFLCDNDRYRGGPALLEAKELAVSLGVAEDMAYLDFDENPFRYMSRAAVVALSSRYEGFANVLVEAMACGTPVASTDAPYGPFDILEGGRWGPLVPVGDAGALAEALAGILAGQRVSAEDLHARAAMFSMEANLGKYEELFSALASPKLS